MPMYTKLLKNILYDKMKLEEFETIAFSKEYSAILQNKLPLKLNDPTTFYIPCTIGKETFDKALYDLGASISLMSFSFSKRLKIGEL